MEVFYIELAKLSAGLGIPVIIVVLVFLMRLVKSVRDELRTINGQMIKMKQWQDDHEKLDIYRFGQLQKCVEVLERVAKEKK